MLGAVNNDDRGWFSILKPGINASTEASFISEKPKDNPANPNSLAARLASGNVDSPLA